MATHLGRRRRKEWGGGLCLSVFMVSLFLLDPLVVRGETSGGETAVIGMKELECQVKSIRMEEDRLFINEARYVVTQRTRCLDDRGRACTWQSLQSRRIHLIYTQQPTTEMHPYDPRDRVVIEAKALKDRKR